MRAKIIQLRAPKSEQDPHTSTQALHTFEREPTPRELAAIEAESPVIAAGLELLDVEIALLDRPMTELDIRRLRRARCQLIAAESAVYGIASNAPGLKVAA